MTKKTTFRKPATDAILEYMHAHKTATFAELIAALPQVREVHDTGDTGSIAQAQSDCALA